MVKKLYAVWVKIDDTLPWVELEETYKTRKSAQKAAEKLSGNLMVKIVRINKEPKQVKALITVKQ
ncbi:MAG: hypothetical protein QXR63_05435 [Candidatus Bathyarchaeia archaeon]